MRWFIFLGFSVLLSFTSCNTATSPEELCRGQGSWQLVALENGTTVAIPHPERYTIRFEWDGQVNVRADCNSCFGSYGTDGNALSMGTLACTEVFCGPLSFFDSYTAALSTVSSFARRGDELELIHSAGTLRFRIPIASPG